MGREAARQGLAQGRQLSPQRALGQLGQGLGVALAADQRGQHLPAGDAEDLRCHRSARARSSASEASRFRPRAAGARRIRLGAATRQAIPAASHARARPKPVGLAS